MAMACNTKFNAVVGCRISSYSSSSQYEVQALLKSGSFGDFLQCRNTATNKRVALKVLKTWRHTKQAKKEVVIFQTLKELQADKFNIVRCNGSFTFRQHFCVVFEKLDIDLCQFLHKRRHQPLSLMEIRPIVQQLATALDFLKTAGIIHANLKPSNIMMVDHERQPLRVKVIDFGMALKNSDVRTGATLQSKWYRAPEVMLGTPINESIDVWSLGCIAAEMLMNFPLFPGCDEYDMMKHIYYTIGHPAEHMLNSAVYAQYFYSVRFPSIGLPIWTFRPTLEEERFSLYPRTLTSLSDLVKYKVSPNLSWEDNRADECDRAIFVDLLTQTMKVDCAERITPSGILQHSFITMSHLVGTFDHSAYVASGVEMLNVCKNASSDEGQDDAQETLMEVASTSTAGPAPHRGPEEGHSDRPSGSRKQTCPQSTHTSDRYNQSQKRERGYEDNTKCGNRFKKFKQGHDQDRSSHTGLMRKRMNESHGASQTESPVKTNQQKSEQQKRQRDDADECTTSGPSSPTQRRRNLRQQLSNSINQVFSCKEEVWTNFEPLGNTKNRKRACKEASGSNKERATHSNKRRTSPQEEKRKPTDGHDHLKH